MQTFLPYVDFQMSMACLDTARLGKQRSEAATLLRVLGVHLPKIDGSLPDRPRGWANHPCTLMWLNHEDWLKAYYNACLREWIARGYRNNMPMIPQLQISCTQHNRPWWLGYQTFHDSHKSNLIRKNPEFYLRQQGWEDTPRDLPYLWPVYRQADGTIFYRNMGPDIPLNYTRVPIGDTNLIYYRPTTTGRLLFDSPPYTTDATTTATYRIRYAPAQTTNYVSAYIT